MTRPGSKHERRISFNEMNAEHLYEYLLVYWRDDPDAKIFGNCFECQTIGKRLETFIGPESVKMIRKAIKKQPVPELCKHCGHDINATVTRSVVVDLPGHPVAAPCTIDGCQYHARQE